MVPRAGSTDTVKHRTIFLNWWVMNADMEEWDAGIIRALGMPLAKGAEWMSQSALSELAIRQKDMRSRTGESESNVSWTSATDM